MLLMLPGCQRVFKHGISAEDNTDNNTNQSRFCLSFRKLGNTSKKNEDVPSKYVGRAPKLDAGCYQDSQVKLFDNIQVV